MFLFDIIYLFESYLILGYNNPNYGGTPQVNSYPIGFDNIGDGTSNDSMPYPPNPVTTTNPMYNMPPVPPPSRPNIPSSYTQEEPQPSRGFLGSNNKVNNFDDHNEHTDPREKVKK